MYAPETSKNDLVDQQYQEIVAARTAVLNREMVRMRSEGWSVQLAGNHLVATRKEAGRSQMERILIAAVGMLAIAYVAPLTISGLIDKIGASKPVYYVGAAAIGVVLALVSGRQAARSRNVTVSVDSQGRPFVADA